MHFGTPPLTCCPKHAGAPFFWLLDGPASVTAAATPHRRTLHPATKPGRRPTTRNRPNLRLRSSGRHRRSQPGPEAVQLHLGTNSYRKRSGLVSLHVMFCWILQPADMPSELRGARDKHAAGASLLGAQIARRGAIERVLIPWDEVSENLAANIETSSGGLDGIEDQTPVLGDIGINSPRDAVLGDGHTSRRGGTECDARAGVYAERSIFHAVQKRGDTRLPCAPCRDRRGLAAHQRYVSPVAHRGSTPPDNEALPFAAGRYPLPRAAPREPAPR